MEEIRNEEMNEMENEIERIETSNLDVLDEDDNEFVKGLGIGALIGAAGLYIGSKVVKKVGEKIQEAKRKSKIMDFKKKFGKKKKKDEEDLFEDDEDFQEEEVRKLDDDEVEEMPNKE